ncbi:MAG: acyl-CoA synthetase [Gammaproteobacteria bacterium]|nr:acyl-CoA synthetase [Gammaproteobacteria bacterium]
MAYQWSYGDILREIAKVIPAERPALIHGRRVINHADFSTRTNSLARAFLDSGALPGDKVAYYMRNCPEYSEGIAAAFKANLTHVNVNYRYIEHELIYLFDNSDASIVMFQTEFRETVDLIREQLPKIKLWIEVVDSEHEDPVEESPYELLLERTDSSPLDLTYSPDDLLFIYTGGTTGMPKGVMWRHDDLFKVMGAGGNPRIGIPPCTDLDEFITRIQQQPAPINLPLPPMMHGTGLISAIGAMSAGGTCITLPSRRFVPEQALQAIHRHSVSAVTIVGDAFARPMLEALDEQPEQYDISSVKIISSSGVMWTREIKAGLLRHNENLLLVDGFSSSEAIGLGSSVMTKEEEIEVANFTLGPNCKVFTEEGIEVLPGSNESGMVAVTGNLPVGYYKDEQKTAKTFKTINGIRYSIPGDWVQVRADGTLTLLGRGSNCINTAGEKVFPEEVEEAMKMHPTVDDALVVGINDAKWGQAITAVVQLKPGEYCEPGELRESCREFLAAYKSPKHIFVKDSLERAPNGKADYKSIKLFAETQLAKQDT